MLKKNFLTILVALVILLLSMAGAGNFEKVSIARIPHIDKAVHAGMYFALTLVIIFENRKYLSPGKLILIATLVPLVYGIIMELLQMMTATRSGNLFDAVFDFAGILVALLIWIAVRFKVSKPKLQ
jgi:VanZ family protein